MHAALISVCPAELYLTHKLPGLAAVAIGFARHGSMMLVTGFRPSAAMPWPRNLAGLALQSPPLRPSRTKMRDRLPLTFLLPCGSGVVTIFVSLGWQGMKGVLRGPEHAEWF